VLYYGREKQNIHCERYTAIEEVKVSDHRAVIAEFKIEVRQEDKLKKQELIERFLK
jgi:hypothetical protein